MRLLCIALINRDNSERDIYKMTLSLPQIKVSVIQLLQATYSISSFLEDLMLCLITSVPYS